MGAIDRPGSGADASSAPADASSGPADASSAPADAGSVHSDPLERRLHPAAIAVWPLQQSVGIILLLLFGGPGFGAALVLVGLLGTVIASVVRWYRFTWAVTPAGLVVEQGLLQRSRRLIPADRVQSVDLIKPVRHRLFGVVQVRVEAIGGSDTEGLLEALDLRTALEVQHLLVGARAASTRATDVPVEGPRLLARSTPRTLVVAGLTGGRVGVVAVALGSLQQAFGDRIDEVVDVLPAQIDLGLGIVLAGLAVVLVFATSVAATVISYWDFTISRDADELRISRGLLEQRLETVPLRRIQSVRIEQNLLRRGLGLASVKADLAGRAGGGDTTTGLLLPIAPLEDAQRLVADLLSTTGPVMAPLEPAPPRSRRRYWVRGFAVALVAALLSGSAVLGGAPVWVPAMVGAAVGTVSVPLALATWSAIGRATVEGVLVARTGALVRRRVHVPVGRVQRMTVQQSPFQRRLHLADIRIGIARSRGWAGPMMLEVDLEEARDLTARTVHDAVEASRRR